MSSRRRLRAFKRWMTSYQIEYSPSLNLIDFGIHQGISILTLIDLHEGDVIAKIPKNACLTVKTSQARDMIEEAGLGGSLSLAVAVMYEKSFKEGSMWDGYLQVLPERECVPLCWTLDEVELYLVGTELYQIIKEDKALMYEDWKECILPLLAENLELDQKYFGAEQYFAARSLVSSRSFEIDEYHGYGMVPLADLFNHKTGAEHVHITNISSPDSGSDDDSDVDDGEYQNNHSEKPFIEDQKISNETDALKSKEMDLSLNPEEDSGSLEMIIVKGAKSGEEVFNTYGTMGNAALLHRYGFTEPDNSYDIVNIELNMVLDWSSTLFSSRHNRSRLSLWRRIGYSGCVSQSSEYFEIESDGEPQFELLILLYIIFLPDQVYENLNHTVPSNGNIDLLDKNTKRIPLETPNMAKSYLLTDDICNALVSLADIREVSYGKNSLNDDMKLLSNCSIQDRKLYHSLVLRVSERKILKNLRNYGKKKAFVRKCRR
ncbi:hypothetical protein ACHQM5_022601 [Ranunculus cassubicifolius]